LAAPPVARPYSAPRRLLAAGALLLTALGAGAAEAQMPAVNTCSHFLAQCKQVACARPHLLWSCDDYCQGKFNSCLQTGTWSDTTGKTYSNVQKQ
jgi:hypothetical protein